MGFSYLPEANMKGFDFIQVVFPGGNETPEISALGGAHDGRDSCEQASFAK